MKKGVPENQTPREVSATVPKPRKGVPKIQLFRQLKAANPHLEVDEVWALAGYTAEKRAIEAGQAAWADGRASPAEARFRNDPRPD